MTIKNGSKLLRSHKIKLGFKKKIPQFHNVQK